MGYAIGRSGDRLSVWSDDRGYILRRTCRMPGPDDSPSAWAELITFLGEATGESPMPLLKYLELECEVPPPVVWMQVLAMYQPSSH